MALVAEDLDAVPPCGRVIARGAEIENQFEVGEGARDEVVGGAGGALVGVVDDDDGVVGEVIDGEREAVVLIVKGVAAVVEVGADARGTPWRGGEEGAEIHVVED